MKKIIMYFILGTVLTLLLPIKVDHAVGGEAGIDNTYYISTYFVRYKINQLGR